MWYYLTKDERKVSLKKLIKVLKKSIKSQKV
jgi:hypothetical protein